MAALLAIVYGPHLAGSFVSDDAFLIENNRSLDSTKGLKRIWTEDLFGAADQDQGNAYRPLPMSLHWLERQAGLRSLRLLRTENLILHGAVVLGLFALLLRTGVRWAAAAFGSGVLLLHPITVEPVMWISARPEILGSGFALACLAAGFARFPMAWRVVLVFTAAACAALTKETFFLLPLALVLVHLAAGDLQHNRPRLASCALSSAIGVMAALLARSLAGVSADSGQFHVSVAESVRHLGTAWGRYGLHILTLSNGPTKGQYVPWPWAAAIAAVAAAGGTMAALLAKGQRCGICKRAGYSLLLAMLALTPAIAALPITGAWANRYAYWAMLPASAATAYVGDSLFDVVPRLRRVLVVVGCSLLVAAGTLTSLQAGLWRSPLSLYAADVQASPSDPHALYHLGHAIRIERGCAAALPFFQSAFAADPGYARAAHNVAGCLIKLKRFTEAVEPARRAASLEPQNVDHQFNLGLSLTNGGQVEAGIGVLRHVARMKPDHAGARAILEQYAAWQKTVTVPASE